MYVGIAGLVTWKGACINSKSLTIYSCLSFVIGLPNILLPLFGYTNIWTMHAWVLVLICLFGTIISCSMPSKHKSASVVALSLFVTLWFMCIIMLGVSVYHKYAHISFAMYLSFSIPMFSKRLSSGEILLLAASMSDVFLCSLAMAWYTEIPMVWAMRNLIWAAALPVYRVTRIT